MILKLTFEVLPLGYGVQFDRSMPSFQVVFDDAAQLTGQTSPNETRSFTYDGAGRRTAWTDVGFHEVLGELGGQSRLLP